RLSKCNIDDDVFALAAALRRTNKFLSAARLSQARGGQCALAATACRTDASRSRERKSKQSGGVTGCPATNCRTLLFVCSARYQRPSPEISSDSSKGVTSAS